jgi:hypothetical protein
MNLILKEEFEQTVNKENYKTYEGYIASRYSNQHNISVVSDKSGNSGGQQHEVKKKNQNV